MSDTASSTTSSSATQGSVTPLFPSSFTDPASSTTSFMATSVGSPEDGGNGGGDSLQSSAALYLYTFLATLILLLGVSAAIVIRSLVLRRRHRRMIEEAIANGTWIPPPPRNRFDPAKKPVMHEAHIHVDDKQGLLDSWDVLKPFSASYTVAPPWMSSSTTPDENANRSTASVLPERPAFFGRLFQRRRRSPVPATSPAGNATPATSIPMNGVASSSTSNLPSSSSTTLNVSVLIVMPHEKDDADESLPLLEVGVAEVPVQADESSRAGRVGKEIDTPE